jgi:hypothetical protein
MRPASRSESLRSNKLQLNTTMMQQMMSRYGGHDFLIGKGKASHANLPEDQSQVNLLDNYAAEIIPNHYLVSTYDAQPYWMADYASLPNVPGSPRAVKIGTIEHTFNEIPMQYKIEVSTDIYLTHHGNKNVYLSYIMTEGRHLKEFMPNYQKCYDLVLMLCIRDDDLETKLSKNPASLQKLLLINLYKMGATGDCYGKFTASKTPLGKNLPDDIDAILRKSLATMESDEALVASLNSIQT